ncbi:hypothetical protein C8Q74DRAFT_293453 [Fomes fomentarius]|nr:hypothetical protein C8Q74DRAFT_293453 [Fomes fomentarius]
MSHAAEERCTVIEAPRSCRRGLRWTRARPSHPDVSSSPGTCITRRTRRRWRASSRRTPSPAAGMTSVRLPLLIRTHAREYDSGSPSIATPPLLDPAPRTLARLRLRIRGYTSRPASRPRRRPAASTTPFICESHEGGDRRWGIGKRYRRKCGARQCGRRSYRWLREIASGRARARTGLGMRRKEVERKEKGGHRRSGRGSCEWC